MEARDDLLIQAEWCALRELRPSIPHYTVYHVNQWAQIDAQVRTLYDRLTLREIKARYSDLDVRSAAEDALYWMRGGDVLSPSDSWNGLLTPRFSAEKVGVAVGISSATRF